MVRRCPHFLNNNRNPFGKKEEFESINLCIGYFFFSLASAECPFPKPAIICRLLRQNPSKFVQAVGRGMRICEGQKRLLNIGFWRETPNGWALLTISNHRKRRGPGKMGRGKLQQKSALNVIVSFLSPFARAQNAGTSFPHLAPMTRQHTKGI